MNPNTSTNAEPLNVASFHARRRPDGHINHGDPIVDRHDYRDWVEWDPDQGIPHGTRVRQEWVMGSDPATRRRVYVHPDDVPTDPDAELVEAVAKVLAEKQRLGDIPGWELHNWPSWTDHARDVIRAVRAHDKADR
jgi:hypothetical protein